MKISFFEEYPTKNNLNKLNLIKFPIKLYISAHSLKEFNKIKNKIKSRYVKQLIYWPILKRKEGYYISAFSKSESLNRIFDEVSGKKVIVMLDVEFPYTKKSLFFSQFFNSFKNKKIINRFIKKHKKVLCCENFFAGSLFKFLGLSFKIENKKKIKMFYSSMLHFSRKTKDNILTKLAKKKYILALGTIATGETGNEFILTPEELDKDLDILKKNKIKEVIIFRLGGLNKNYIRILKNIYRSAPGRI